MNTSIIPFDFFGSEIRVMDIEGCPWFFASEVCAILGYNNPWDAVSKHCREAGIAKREVRVGDQNRQVTIISESNLYRLVMRSRLPSAQRFEEWVVGEVLPAIRKTGTYATRQFKELEAKLRDAQNQITRLRTGITPRIRVSQVAREKANELTERLRETEPTTTRMEAIEWALNQAFASLPASRQTSLNLESIR